MVTYNITFLVTIRFSFQIVDRDSYILVWELLILLMRQKNTIDGSDIAELLLKDRKDIHLPYASNKAKLVVMVYLNVSLPGCFPN